MLLVFLSMKFYLSQIRLFSPSKEVSELPIFEFKPGSFKFESSFKDSLSSICLKKLKSLVTDPDWLPKFLKHFIVFLPTLLQNIIFF